jgi:histidine triad (HIT) family protein
MTVEECVFCGVVAGTVESSQVYEDEEVLAFMDIQPTTPGHLFVILKVRVPYRVDLDEEPGTAMFRVALRLAGALRESALPCDGANTFLAHGASG